MKTLTHQTVRDLHWAVNSTSPYTLDGLCHWFDDSAWFAELLAALNARPQPLIDAIAQKKLTALGIYFESLWQFYFLHHPDYEVIAQNLQIIIDKQTLGELDIVVQNVHTQRVTHIELSCKFYMNIANRASLQPLNCWYGPNLADNLEIKYTKTINQQLPFVQLPQVKEYLEQRNIFIDESIAIIKGNAFYPAQTNHSNYWLSTDELKQLPSKSQYRILEKSDWLALQILDTKVLNAGSLLQHFAIKGSDFKPTQVSVFNEHATQSTIEEQGRDKEMEESHRVFVVSDTWLHNAKKHLQPLTMNS